MAGYSKAEIDERLGLIARLERLLDQSAEDLERWPHYEQEMQKVLGRLAELRGEAAA